MPKPVPQSEDPDSLYFGGDRFILWCYRRLGIPLPEDYQHALNGHKEVEGETDA